jgi:hypothetical protein
MCPKRPQRRPGLHWAAAAPSKRFYSVLERAIRISVRGGIEIRIQAAGTRTVDCRIPKGPAICSARGGVERLVHRRLIIRSAKMPLNMGWFLIARSIQAFVLREHRAGQGSGNDSDSTECFDGHDAFHLVGANPSLRIHNPGRAKAVPTTRFKRT